MAISDAIPIKMDSTGRGNNWAHGYNEERIQEIINKLEVRESVVMIHSLAGGTGSGLGSRIAEEIRDQVNSIKPLCFLTKASENSYR